MVFFTCAHCGESVKKPKVEKHYQTKCSRNPIALTCIDCCKDFSAKTYPAHTKCVTEEEKYSAKGYQPKPSSNKGEQKQQKWQEVIESLRTSYKGQLSEEERIILDILVNHHNVPRKKIKFQNFLKNVGRNCSSNAVSSIFDKIEAQNKSENDEKSKENKQEEEEKENTGMEVKEEIPAEGPAVEEEKLSKKEKKEKRKRAKYEAELKAIESNQMGVEAENEGNSEGKKKKKSKKGETFENEITEEEKLKKKKNKTHAEENGIDENGVSREVEATEGKKFKKKHKKEKDVVGNGLEDVEEEVKQTKKRKKQNVEEEEEKEEPSVKKVKESSTEDAAEEEQSAKSGKSKFNWQDMIVKVLTAKGEKEMSLKKVRRKVLAEFESMGCGSASDEKTIAKFNKKVQHTPGVVVLKDTVKLVVKE